MHLPESIYRKKCYFPNEQFREAAQYISLGANSNEGTWYHITRLKCDLHHADRESRGVQGDQEGWSL